MTHEFEPKKMYSYLSMLASVKANCESIILHLDWIWTFTLIDRCGLMAAHDLKSVRECSEVWHKETRNSLKFDLGLCMRIHTQRGEHGDVYLFDACFKFVPNHLLTGEFIIAHLLALINVMNVIILKMTRQSAWQSTLIRNDAFCIPALADWLIEPNNNNGSRKRRRQWAIVAGMRNGAKQLC